VKRLLLLAAFVIAQGQASVMLLELNDYVTALESIRSSIRAGDPTAARTMAEQLNGAQVDAVDGRFTADAALLHEIMASPQSAVPHLDATIDALRGRAAATPLPAADPRLINQLRVEQSPPDLRRGGEIDLAPAADEKTLEKTAGWFSKAWGWITKQWEKLANWFDRWWPKESLKERKAKTGGSVRGLVIGIVVAIIIVIAILAYEVVRRSRAELPAPLAKSDLLASKRDDDPLSRGATEWERYAGQLAAAGRVREAIRAWYHAVLVTLYGAGILHFRKGRTNWEYVAALSPEIAWRTEFVLLTRRFEEEWYGRDRSTVEAFEEVRDLAQSIVDIVRRRVAA